jgi:hypothetical protein
VRKEKTRVNLGTDSKHLLIINTVCQTLFAYGHYTNESIYKERGLTILQHLPAESNRIIKQFKDLGFSIKDASESQGAIGLRKLFCEKRACMQCQIGKKLMM